MRFFLSYSLIVFAASGSFAQQPETVDGIAGAPPAGASLPGERVAPEIDAELVELPPTLRPAHQNESDDQPGSFIIAGYVKAAPEGLLADPTWRETPDGGWIFALELTSEKAEALRVRLKGDFSVSSLELRFYDPARGAAFGPNRLPMLDEKGMWWSTIIFGDSIGLEFYLPAGEAVPAELPELTEIAYNYEPPPPPGGPLTGCTHRDVSCEPDWRDSAEAVTLLATIVQGTLSTFCSGALLNRGPGDFSPIVMTANHCVSTQGRAGNTVFVWGFETPTCNGSPPNPNNLPRSNGSLLLKRYTDSDWTLLGLYEAPGASRYLGWSSGFWDNDTAGIGIHHPGGMFKRISLGTKIDDYKGRFCDDDGENCFDAEIWEVDYGIGFTQGGSSGSPVMDAAHRVRGALTGGPTDDCTISKYGRFDLAFNNNLRYYLSDAYIASPVYVNRNVGGDPGNNGNTEQGNPVYPFNTVYEATFAVIAGDRVRISPGTYNERMTIWRPMRIERAGTSGTVRIGG